MRVLPVNPGDMIFTQPATTFPGGVSDAGLLTSFSGFLYNPQGDTPSSWVRKRDSSVSDTTVTGMDRVSMSPVIPEVGIVWSSDKLTVQHSGIYLVLLAGFKTATDLHVSIVIVDDINLKI